MCLDVHTVLLLLFALDRCCATCKARFLLQGVRPSDPSVLFFLGSIIVFAWSGDNLISVAGWCCLLHAFWVANMSLAKESSMQVNEECHCNSYIKIKWNAFKLQTQQSISPWKWLQEVSVATRFYSLSNVTRWAPYQSLWSLVIHFSKTKLIHVSIIQKYAWRSFTIQ